MYPETHWGVHPGQRFSYELDDRSVMRDSWRYSLSETIAASHSMPDEAALLACSNPWRQRLPDSNVIPQHQLLRVRMQVHLLVHPLGHRMPVQVMLEPVRSYVSGTISSTSPCR
jgi:hypothetical protein